MEVLLIILGLAVVALLLFGYYALWQWLNERCARKHHFVPLNGWSVFAATVAAIGLQVGIAMVADQGWNIPPWPWPEAFLHSTTANGLALAAAGSLVAIGTLGTLIWKTSLLSGLLAGLVLVVAGHFFFVAIVILVVLLFAAAGAGRRRRVYIGD